MEDLEANLIQTRKACRIEQVVAKWLHRSRDGASRGRVSVTDSTSDGSGQPASRVKLTVTVYKDLILHHYGFEICPNLPLTIASVTAGSTAEGKLQPGDQLLRINSTAVDDMSVERAADIIREAGDELVLTVLRCTSGGPKSSFLTAEKRARLKTNPVKVRFAEEVLVNGHTQGNSLLCMPNVLKVYLENGQTKAFRFETSTTVKDIVLTLKEKLSIQSIVHFALALEEQYNMAKIHLLHEEELIEQVVQKRECHDYRCLFRVCFVPKDPLDLLQEDPIAFEYLYLQSCSDVLHERFAVEMKCSVALRLAALHIQERIYACAQPQKVSLKYIERDWGIENFISPTLLRNMSGKDIKKAISYHMKRNQVLLDPRQKHMLAAVQVRLSYLQILGDLKMYNGKIFNATLMVPHAEEPGCEDGPSEQRGDGTGASVLETKLSEKNAVGYYNLCYSVSPAGSMERNNIGGSLQRSPWEDGLAQEEALCGAEGMAEASDLILEPPPGFGDTSSEEEFYDAADRLSPLDALAGYNMMSPSQEGTDNSFCTLKKPRCYSLEEDLMTRQTAREKHRKEKELTYTKSLRKRRSFLKTDYTSQVTFPLALPGSLQSCCSWPPSPPRLAQRPAPCSSEDIKKDAALGLPAATQAQRDAASSNTSSDLMEMEPDTLETKSLTDSVLSSISAVRLPGDLHREESAGVTTHVDGGLQPAHAVHPPSLSLEEAVPLPGGQSRAAEGSSSMKACTGWLSEESCVATGSWLAQVALEEAGEVVAAQHTTGDVPPFLGQEVTCPANGHMLLPSAHGPSVASPLEVAQDQDLTSPSPSQERVDSPRELLASQKTCGCLGADAVRKEMQTAPAESPFEKELVSSQDEAEPRKDMGNGAHKQLQPVQTPLPKEQAGEVGKDSPLTPSLRLSVSSGPIPLGSLGKRAGDHGASKLCFLCFNYKKDEQTPSDPIMTRSLAFSTVKMTSPPQLGVDKCSCRLSYISCFHRADDKGEHETTIPTCSTFVGPLTTPPSSGCGLPGTSLSRYPVSIGRDAAWEDPHVQALSQLKDQARMSPADFSCFLAYTTELQEVVGKLSGNEATHLQDQCAEQGAESKGALGLASQELLSSCQEFLKTEQSLQELQGALRVTFDHLVQLAVACFQVTHCQLCRQRQQELGAALVDVVGTYHQLVQAVHQQLHRQGCPDLGAKLLAHQHTAFTAAMFCLLQQFRVPPLS
ncbi:FERM and PDZ domain-containing protein 1-like isoform X9 [Falco biarmicus]|uniref:FERM and PDZ domain-containing protein 1-like isoform X9 n=1 Tax=Falco biarmicus TaxID=345155 RepID=UPI0024BC50EC|nr:FERM and PDZ domain-containing protein 1-like isoform X9 [Falco biarmicus]